MRNEKPTRKRATPLYVDQRRGVYGGLSSNGATALSERSQKMNESDYGVFIPAPPSSDNRCNRLQLPSSEQAGEDSEFTTNWSRNSSYRGYSGGSRFRRYRNDNNSFRQTQANGLRRNCFSQGCPEVGMDDAYYGESEVTKSNKKRENNTSLRSASMPTSGLERSYGSSHNRSLSDDSDFLCDSQATQSPSTPHRKRKSCLDVPMPLTAVLSDEQTARLRNCLNSSSISRNRAKIKVLEFLQYWLSDERACAAIDAAITDTLRSAGIENFHKSRDRASSDECCASNLSSENTLTHFVEQGLKPVDSMETSPSCLSTVVFEKNKLELPIQVCKDDTSISGNGAKHTSSTLQLNGDSSGERWATRLNSRSSPSISFTPPKTQADLITIERYTPDRVLATSTNVEKQKEVSVVTATLGEIPRFYHPYGAPLSTEESLVGPQSKKHENPHLKIEDGVVLPAAVYDAQEDKLPMGGGLTPSQRKTKTVSIAPLKAINDRDVPQFIQNEFNRLSSHFKAGHGSRLLSSLGKGFNGGSTSNTLVKPGNYKHQIIHVVQRICTQCLGLPKYFSFLIIQILKYDADHVHASTASLRGNTSPGASSTSIGMKSHSIITAQGMRELFEKYLRGHSIVRRLFVLFQLSSYTTSNMSPCASTTGIGTEPKYQLRSFLLPGDFRTYIRVLLDHHPGLAFLKQTPDFQNRYSETVIYRIFYDIDRLDRGRITYAELENSRLPDALRFVDAADDINSVLLYFSYEHFYVLYCRFWELDKDRDMHISRQEFLKYSPDNVMNPLIADRVFAGVGRRISCGIKNCIGYEDFVWFCLSEEDKSTPTAIRYWFRILDLDGDGLLSAYELQVFYEATKEKVASYAPDSVTSFEDVICQIFDLFGVKLCCGLRLADLLANPEAAFVAINMVTNVVRFLMFEHHDPLVLHNERLNGGLEQTPWDHFARAEYDCMSHEVNGS